MSKKKILILTSTFPRWAGDTEPRFVFDLSKNYVRSGFQVDVVAPHARGARLHEEIEGVYIYRYKYFLERYQALAYSGGILANLKKNRLNYFLVPFFLLFQLLAIYKRLKFGKYDLIHSHWLIPQTLLCLLVKNFLSTENIPVLCTSHGADLYSLNSLVMRTLKRWVIRRCTQLCVVSEAMKRDIQDLVTGTDKVTVLPMGVDLQNLFIPVPGIERLDNRVIFVGRFVEKKGIDVLIDAIKKVCIRVSSVEVVMVGDGPLRRKLEDKVDSSGLNNVIKFYGSRENHALPVLFSSAGIAVVPSIVDSQGDREGLGLVTIEAMGCGCAVVASALGPILEIVDHGKSGLLFEAGNTDALAECLISLLEHPDLARSLSGSGRECVKHKFDWNYVTENYVSLIRRMLTT